MSRYSEIRRQITQNVDFGQYLETEVGLEISWNLSGESGMAVCPLHGDSEPSFSISLIDGTWLYHCFGCQSAGTIIEFFMERYDIRSVKAAMEVICEKFDIKESLDTISDSFAAAGGRINTKKRCLGAHINAANRCRILLREKHRDAEVVRWIVEKYCEMNQALVENDFTRLDEISEEASCAIRENSIPS